MSENEIENSRQEPVFLRRAPQAGGVETGEREKPGQKDRIGGDEGEGPDRDRLRRFRVGGVSSVARPARQFGGYWNRTSSRATS